MAQMSPDTDPLRRRASLRRAYSRMGIALEAAALERIPTPALVLDQEKTTVVANIAARKLLGAIDTSLIGLPLYELSITSSNTGGLPYLDCAAVLASLENRWLSRRGSMVPGFGLETISETLSKVKSKTLYAPHTSNNDDGDEEEENDDQNLESQEIRINVSIVQHRSPLADRDLEPIQAKMTASTFALQDRHYFLLTFETSTSRSKRPSLVAPIQFHVDEASKTDGLQRVHSSTCASSLTAPLQLKELQWTDSIGSLHRSSFNSLRNKIVLISVDEKVCIPNNLFMKALGYDASQLKAYDCAEFVSTMEPYDEHFRQKLVGESFPLNDIVRSRTNFKSRRVGFLHRESGERKVFSVEGECIWDPETGALLGGTARFFEIEGLSSILVPGKTWIGAHETTLDTMPVQIWTMLPNGGYDYMNNCWYEYTGLNAQQSLGLGYQQMIHPCDLWKVQSNRPDLMDSGKFEQEIRYRRWNGDYRWFLTRSAPLRDADGRILKYYGTNTDIHEIVLAREKEKRRGEQLKAGLAHAEIHLFATDEEGAVILSEGDTSWTMQARKSLKSSGLVGKNLFEVMKRLSTEAQLEDYVNMMRTVMQDKNGKIGTSETTIYGRTFKTRFIPDIETIDIKTSSCTTTSQTCGLIGVSIDVTDLKARQVLEIEKERLLVLEHAATTSNCLKSQFLANMSHEIRTPLAGIAGLTSLLCTTNLDEEQAEHVEGIKLSSNILLTIVNDVLDFAKIESGRMDIEKISFTPFDMVNELIKLMRYSMKSKGFTFECQNELPPTLKLMGDPGRIRQVLVNLLSNSFKFTHKGYVRLRASITEVQPVCTNVNVVFTVLDTGIGMSEDVLKNLFQPFRQGDPSTARLFGGTGLGLTICKHLLQLMDGDVMMESEASVGTKATVILPLEACHHSGPQSLPTPPSEQEDLMEELHRIGTGRLSPEERAHTHILLVEDNPINRAIAIKTVRKLGYNISSANDGKQALDQLRVMVDKPAVILMDVQMPVMDGYEATTRLRNDEIFTGMHALRDVPVIALTASAIQGDREKCIAAGMNDYLSKPFSTEALDRMILKWVFKRRSQQYEQD